MNPPLVRIATLVVLLATAGCHTFQRTSYEQISPGERVRARVNSAWADSLDALLQRDARVVEGTVVEKPDGALLLEVAVQNELRGIEFQTLSQRVRIPETAFVDLELSRLDRGRTLGLVALAGAVVTAFVVQQLSEESGGGTIPGGGGPVESPVAPLLRIPFP